MSNPLLDYLIHGFAPSHSDNPSQSMENHSVHGIEHLTPRKSHHSTQASIISLSIDLSVLTPSQLLHTKIQFNRTEDTFLAEATNSLVFFEPETQISHSSFQVSSPTRRHNTFLTSPSTNTHQNPEPHPSLLPLIFYHPTLTCHLPLPAIPDLLTQMDILQQSNSASWPV